MMGFLVEVGRLPGGGAWLCFWGPWRRPLFLSWGSPWCVSFPFWVWVRVRFFVSVLLFCCAIFVGWFLAGGCLPLLVCLASLCGLLSLAGLVCGFLALVSAAFSSLP